MLLSLHHQSKTINMSKEVKLKTIEQNDNVGLYSICFNGSDKSEFENFLETFRENGKYNREFNIILLSLSKIIEKGALERLFRPEGKMSDDVCALSIDTHSLRLYCLRMSDKILILGNGGVKSTKTYQEDKGLNGYVVDLQLFDKALKDAQKKGKVTIEKSVITNIQSATFLI